MKLLLIFSLRHSCTAFDVHHLAVAVPLTIECLLLCRPGKEGKEFGVPLNSTAFVSRVQKVLEDVQSSLFSAATAFRDANIRDVSTYEELKEAIAQGFWARGPWAGGPDALPTLIDP